MASNGAVQEMTEQGSRNTEGNTVEDTKSKQPNEPKNSKFTQQNLPACRPLMTPLVVVVVFFTLGIVFIPIGVIALQASRSVVQKIVRYDDVSLCTGGGSSNKEREENLLKQGGNGFECTVRLHIDEDMDKPVYFYYELNNYYQNHRRYVKSRDDVQLRGDDSSSGGLLGSLGLSGSAGDCSPQDEQEGTEEEIIPCGLIAWSYFNDTYTFTLKPAGSNISEEQAEPLAVDEKGIAWRSDVNEKFGHFKAENFNNIPEYRGGGTIDGYVDEDEHFIVWMRTATLPHFRKLWGKIDQDLKKDDEVYIRVTNRYNTYRFDGKKKLVLSTTSWLGGQNEFLGIAYVVMGCMCVALGILFLVIHMINPRPLGDQQYLSWNRLSEK
eukprot:CAMPEP_0196576520 /NCGR_PEP_ID=MMETSP1081-20130531/5748_1 /TAXON_ID=36882 /ORGANISM="Pyramimonas amylifera, Strain CCMP720" /LENGTH=380 /DNA_ID=CAMNT_0041895139 /DNA_START=73 /DNA_END=1215 /DNA_ORIENTATION=-